MTASIHDLFPPATPLTGEFDASLEARAPCDGRGVVTPLRSCPQINLERAARATRDAGMCEALRVDLYAQFRPEPSLWQRIKAMREDVPEAVRLVLGDIVARPQSHALVAIVAFNLPLLALLIGAWWVGVFQ
jgi:hypothetical protein